MGSTTVEAGRVAFIVAPFGIEADHPRNSDLLIQSIPGCRLRSTIIGSRPFTDKRGDIRVPKDQTMALASLPRIPGMQLHVNPSKCTYVVSDPLAKDTELCARLTRWMRENTEMRSSSTIAGVPVLSGTLDAHRMKTLCREVFNLLVYDEAKVIAGPKPEMDEIDQLPGHYLLNPGMKTATTQPIYEKDWDDWVATLSHSGG